jgi:hypothetical protein
MRNRLKTGVVLSAAFVLVGSIAQGLQWRDSLESVRIPNSPPRGRIRGVDFKPDRVELQGSHLTIRQGADFFADLEFRVLMSGPQSALQGRKFKVDEDMELGRIPHVHMSWRPKGESLPKTKMYMDGYLMRLEFGRISNGRLPGKIYLCIPDFKRSYVAGAFSAVVK